MSWRQMVRGAVIEKSTTASKSIATGAVSLTAICAVFGFGIVWITTGTQGQGASGMWVIFPMIAVAGAHVLMGPAALLLALLSRRLWVNFVVFSYFTVGIWCIWTMMSGRSPVELVATNVTESWSAFVEAREFPLETQLCQSLATRLREGGRTKLDLQPVTLAEATSLDVNFLCRHREMRLPKHLHSFYRSTPIQLAAVSLDVDLLKLLIAHGALIDEPVTEGFTPLMLAMSNATGFSVHGSMNQRPYSPRIKAAAKALIDAGADINIRDTYGAGPLHWAAGTGDPNLVQLLLGAGASVNSSKNTDQKSPAYISIEAVRDLNLRLLTYKNISRDDYALWFTGQKTILKIFIDAGTDIEDVLWAAIHLDGRWALELLLATGVDIQELLTLHGARYLQHAMRNHYRDLVDFLIALGIDVNQPTWHGGRLITEFLMPRHDWHLSVLLDAGADVNMTNKQGDTALEIAVKNRNDAAVQLLLNAGAIVTQKAINNATVEMGTLLELHRREAQSNKPIPDE